MSDKRLSDGVNNAGTMTNKNKTVSFRINEDKFEELREIADQRDISLSKVFRDYVDMLINHDGHIQIVPEHQVPEATDDTFPPKVEVPKSFIREHERLELEAEHLREQLDEYKRYATHLKSKLDEQEEAEEDVVHLEDLDATISMDDEDDTFLLE